MRNEAREVAKGGHDHETSTDRQRHGSQWLRIFGIEGQMSLAMTSRHELLATHPFPLAAQQSQRNLDERRIVTILFCDVVGSTAMAGRLDPEEWADIMHEAFQGLIGPIERYGGTIGRLMGDAVLAFFGAPQAHEDDPQRAILAGLAIIEALQPLRERVLALYGLDFDIRIGINTGLVVVGDFGTHERFEYTAMGDAINIAAKTQQAALPGTIYVAEATQQIVTPLFELEPAGHLASHGLAQPEAVYRVVRHSVVAGRPWDVAGQRSPLIDRDEELAALKHAFDGLRDGCGQIVLVSGDAGLGKSRLLEELRRYWEADTQDAEADPDRTPVVLLDNRLISYGVQRPYGALQQRLQRTLGLDPADSADEIREKIVQFSAKLPPVVVERLISVTMRILALGGDSGAPAFDSDSTGLDAETFQRELYFVMSEILRNLNQGGPVVYMGDDHHLFDAASADLLGHVFELVEQAPILFVSAFRPDESSPVWALRETARTRYAAHCTEIMLEPLNETASGQLVDALIDAPREFAELRELILDKADGNPLFIEEIVRSLRQQGVLLPGAGQATARYQPAPDVDYWSVTIPSSIQALLLQRIDNLATDARRVLLQAAVIGRTFSRAVLAAILNGDSGLDETLADLERLGLLQASPAAPEGEYSFQHTMLWEVAYATLSRRRRRETHGRVAETLEAQLDSPPDERAARLGYHYFEANDARGIHWLLLAAEHARLVYAPEAIIEAITRAETLARGQQLELPASAYLRRGHAAETTGDYTSARADFEMAAERARADGVPCEEWQALISLGMAWAERDYERAGDYYRASLELAGSLPDESTLAHSLNHMGNWYSNAGCPRQAFVAHEQALAIFHRLEHQQGLAETRDMLGMAHFLAGDLLASDQAFEEAAALFRLLDERQGLASALAMRSLVSGAVSSVTVPSVPRTAQAARQFADEALEIASGIGWEAGEAFALASMAAIEEIRGDFEPARAHGERALRIAERIGHRQWTVDGHLFLGALRLSLFQFDTARDHLERAFNGAHEIRSVWWTGTSAALLAAVHIAAGEYERARDVLECVVDHDNPPDTMAMRGCWHQRAVLAFETGHVDEALAIVATLKRDTAGVVPHLDWLRGQALTRLKRFDEAEAALDAARAMAETLGHGSVLWRIDRALLTLYRDTGDDARATVAFERASAGIDALAAGLIDDETREHFRQQAVAFLEEALVPA